MDCIEGMKLIPSNSIDLIITDPPFAIDFKSKKSNYNRKESRVIKGYNEIPKEEYYKFTTNWIKEAYRVLKESGSMYIFSGWNNLKDILIALDEQKFILVNHLIWKYQFGVVTNRKYITSHYHILYVCKNDKLRKFYPYARYNKDDKDDKGRKLHYLDREDVWFIKREYWTGAQKTPTKLPSELIKKIIMYSSKENDIILDPFLGSGQVVFISKMMNRQFIGFEIVKESYEFAKKRLENNIYKLKDTKEIVENYLFNK
jgi:site-specific DNA-methyltransferase (adenine-specific)